MGKGVIDSRHKAWMGTTALSANDYSHEIIRHSDLIILIGHDVVRPFEPLHFSRHQGDSTRPKPCHVYWHSRLLEMQR